MTLAELNDVGLQQFVAALGWIFEGSPWVAERVWARRPFASVEALHRGMMAEVLEADTAEQMELLRAHPDLGARARMSDASQGEQAGAGLDTVTAEELDKLQRLNAAYRARFGFPFLFAVKGSTKHDILQALEDRLSAAPDAELAEALQQVFRIAQFRLHDAIEAPFSRDADREKM